MLRVDGQHIAAVVVIQLYGYVDTNTLNKGKEKKNIYNLIENKYVNRKTKKRKNNHLPKALIKID
jgi:hypothetical protein